MKIALISPFADISSIGIRSISAYLKAHGISTRLIFLPLQKNFYSREAFSLYPDRVINQLAELLKDTDLIGISLMSNFYETVKDLTLKLKAKLPETPVVWGGIHPTVMPEQAIETTDYVCIGEGEIPMLELCTRIADGKPAFNIPGIWAKTNDKIHKNNPCHVIIDLDQIPPQDYDLEDNHILVSKNKLIQITKDNIHTFLGITYWTMYSRGCPFSCTYCCNDALRNIHKDFARIRSKSPENMIKEIVAIKKAFPFIRYINFQDDTFFALSEEQIEQFCIQYKKQVNLPFMIPGVHPAVFTEKKFDTLVENGMLRVRMGIQSGSKRTNEHIYKRRQDNEKIIHISHTFHKYASKLSMPIYDIIVDNPWETADDTLQTIDLLSELAPPFSLNVFSLRLFPGTSLYYKALKENILCEGSRYEHYLSYRHNYLNLIIQLFALFTVPKWLLKLLLSKQLVNTKKEFNFLHTILYNCILYRRGFRSLLSGDISMLPPRMQLFLCRFF